MGESARGIKAHYQASDKVAIVNCLDKLAGLVKEHCALLLRGDELAFARVAKVSSDESRTLTEKYSINPIKRKAEEAWLAKDYDKVISLYSSVQASLSEIEKKRFDYACKRIKD